MRSACTTGRDRSRPLLSHVAQTVAGSEAGSEAVVFKRFPGFGGGFVKDNFEIALAEKVVQDGLADGCYVDEYSNKYPPASGKKATKKSNSYGPTYAYHLCRSDSDCLAGRTCMTLARAIGGGSLERGKSMGKAWGNVQAFAAKLDKGGPMLKVCIGAPDPSCCSGVPPWMQMCHDEGSNGRACLCRLKHSSGQTHDMMPGGSKKDAEALKAKVDDAGSCTKWPSKIKNVCTSNVGIKK